MLRALFKGFVQTMQLQLETRYMTIPATVLQSLSAYVQATIRQ